MDYLTFMKVLAEASRRRETVVVRVGIVHPKKSKDALEKLKDLRKHGWVLNPPGPPRAEIWEWLKRARSVVEIRQIARELHERYREISVPQWRALHSHAGDLLRAKQLHNYPRSNRPRSDDKRIHFLAKVLAGFMVGFAPTTATKRLARLHLPNNHDITGSFEEYATMFSKLPHKGEKK
jgi:hypothetical protein